MTLDIDHFRARLETRRDYLNGKLHKLENALDREPPKDAEDRATEREDDEVMEGLGNQGLAEIRQIDAALERIAQGSYGECQTCGEEISAARLDVVPHATRCRNCA